MRYIAFFSLIVLMLQPASAHSECVGESGQDEAFSVTAPEQDEVFWTVNCGAGCQIKSQVWYMRKKKEIDQAVVRSD